MPDTGYFERIGLLTRMRPPFVLSSGRGASRHSLSSADFITITCEFEFSVHTGQDRTLFVKREIGVIDDLGRMTEGLRWMQELVEIKIRAFSVGHVLSPSTVFCESVNLLYLDCPGFRFFCLRQRQQKNTVVHFRGDLALIDLA